MIVNEIILHLRECLAESYPIERKTPWGKYTEFFSVSHKVF